MATGQERNRTTGNENRAHSGSHIHTGSSRGGSHSQGNTSHRGFAAMDNSRQREIASMGGKAAHESGHAHEFNSEEAREAGRKGGESVSRDKVHMADIGRKGGER